MSEKRKYRERRSYEGSLETTENHRRRKKRRRSSSYRNYRKYSSESINSNDSGSSYDSTKGSYTGVLGDSINNRYEVFNELGTGTFGRVLACIDNGPTEAHNFQQQVVAVKVVRSVPRYVDSAKVEAEMLEKVKRGLLKLLRFRDVSEPTNISEETQTLLNDYAIRQDSWCLDLIDDFVWKSHYCLVSETLGLSLYSIIKSNKHKGFCLASTLIMAQQLIAALLFLKTQCRIVHTDLKLENILFVNDSRIIELLEKRKNSKKFQAFMEPLFRNDLKIKLIDFGGAFRIEESGNLIKKRFSMVNTRQYRSPEVTLEAGWDYQSDIWSAGCIIFEFFVGELLFSTHNEHEHLALIETITKRKFSEEPKFIRNCGRRDNFFKKRGDGFVLRWPEKSPGRESTDFVAQSSSLSRSIKRIVDANEDRQELENSFIKLLQKMIDLNPNKRISAKHAMKDINAILLKYDL